MGRYRFGMALALLAGVIFVSCRQEPLAISTPPVLVPTQEISFVTATAERATRRAQQGTATVEQVTVTGSAQATETITTVNTATPLPTARALPTARVSPTARATPTVGATSNATATVPPPLPTATADITPTEEPTAQATATVTPEAQAVVIHYFRLLSDEEMNPGRRLTFSWSAQGESAILSAGTRMRFAEWWQVPLSDTMTIELTHTLFRNPGVSLTVSGPEQADGAPRVQAVETITLLWACDHEYFFSPSPQRCPRDAATRPAAVQQEFEGGRMVWLQPEGKILVMYHQPFSEPDGAPLRVFDDLWREGEPASDPEIVPPEGRLQPVRGFGKLWRENADVRAGLGWAVAPEAAYMATWQFEYNESIGSTSYLQLYDGSLVQISGYYAGYGRWRHWQP